MNPFLRQPHIFANGEFRIQLYGANQFPLNVAMLNTVENLVFDNEIKWDEITLLARPISNMTGQELIKVRGAMASSLEPEERQSLIQQFEYLAWKENKMSREYLLDLLEIGVYPFDQDHFGKKFLEKYFKH